MPSPSRRPPPLEVVSAIDILAPLQALSREPFQEVLALCLQATPTPQRLREFAADYPDRWANMLAIMGRLAGFSDKVETTSRNLHVHAVTALSDAELLSKLDMIRAEPESAEVMAALDAMPDTARRHLLLEAASEPAITTGGKTPTSSPKPATKKRSALRIRGISKLVTVVAATRSER